MKTYLFLCLFVCSNFILIAQNTFQIPDTTTEKNHLFEKKYWGITFNNSWTSIGNILGGNQVESFFFKPSVGGGITYQQYFDKNTSLGLEISLQFQQRGAGIYYFDDNNQNNIDSTNRWRYRFHNFELPINFLWRSKKTIGKGEGVRWSGQLGFIPSYTHLARRVYISSEDGKHVLINETNNFQKFNLLGNLSFGVDIASGTNTIFQVHFQTQVGINNAYKNDYSQFSGRHLLFGLKISALFR